MTRHEYFDLLEVAKLIDGAGVAHTGELAEVSDIPPDTHVDVENSDGATFVGDVSAIQAGTDLDFVDDGDGSVTIEYVGSSGSDTRVDVENQDGSPLVSNVTAIHAGTDLDFVDDGDGSVTIEYVGVSSNTHTDVSDSSGVVVPSTGDITFTASGAADVSVSADGDQTATIDVSATDTDTDTHVAVENSDGTTLVGDVGAIQAGAELSFADDGDGSVTIEYVGTHYSDSDAVAAINNDSDHGSTASHNYFSGNHGDLSGVSAGDHHSRYTDSEAVTAVNNDSDHGSTASHNYFSGSHNDLSDVSAGDHHTRYADSEAVSAVESSDPLSLPGVLALGDNAANPAANGEFARNGSDVIVYTGGSTLNLSNVGTSSYGDEDAQDAVGTILASNFTYDDAAPSISLSSDTVTVAGNSVALGDSTAIAHGDLSDAPSSAHHSRYTDSEAVTAVNNDTDHGSTASHNYFSGSHNDLSDVSAGDHHSRYTDGEAVSAVNNDGDHGSTASHNYYTDEQNRDTTAAFVTGGSDISVSHDDPNNSLTVAFTGSTFSGSHDDLSNVSAGDHHSRYTDSEAVTAVNNDSDHGSTASHNYFSGSHDDLSGVSSGDHHSKTTSASDLSDVSADSVSDAHHAKTQTSDVTSANWGDYEIQKNGTDGQGIINFKT